MICWINGKQVVAEELQISPFDHGFLYGLGFFETFRTYEGQVFLYESHMIRLRSALADYRIEMRYSDEEILSAIHSLYKENGYEDGYYRLNVSAGVHNIGLAPTQYEQPNVLIFQKSLHLPPVHTEKDGVWLATTRNEPESVIRHKSHQYANNIKGRLELTSLKETEGLFVTSDGYVAEGITSNVFWVKQGQLYTPSLETGILPGTTRAFVIEMAGGIGLPIHEGLYMQDELESADEVFITNAIQELVPIRQVGEVLFSGKEGSVYQRLHAGYQQAVNRMKVSD
ncbi:4-amino-4-deoxychorismate lyase [Sporosarcina sp. P12(2017)]|uniref:aminodeoxychorismate lyase n=1 Tax=unclassified Sporosarcina TaxID=2647733 RepID=UPI000C17220B|nr:MULTISPECIES: aminodeoxychorismate lyase [unclassified Sporosarcina]PIC56400.1 4-amino-4-deoxychorismate lyase [Sporosarcina sp. P10]PIC59697.1 4-amino-4-deoxychorismate lyase [Sporosarcina sp. P12(2017)]